MGKKRASLRSKGSGPSGNKNNTEPGSSKSVSVCGRAPSSTIPSSAAISTQTEAPPPHWLLQSFYVVQDIADNGLSSSNTWSAESFMFASLKNHVYDGEKDKLLHLKEFKDLLAEHVRSKAGSSKEHAGKEHQIAEPGPSNSESVCGRASTSMSLEDVYKEDLHKAKINKAKAKAKAKAQLKEAEAKKKEVERQINDELKTSPADLKRDIEETWKKVRDIGKGKEPALQSDLDLSRASLNELVDAVDRLAMEDDIVAIASLIAHCEEEAN